MGLKAKALDAIFMYALFGSGVGVAAKPNQSRTECEQETLRRRGGDADRSRETIFSIPFEEEIMDLRRLSQRLIEVEPGMRDVLSQNEDCNCLCSAIGLQIRR